MAPIYRNATLSRLTQDSDILKTFARGIYNHKWKVVIFWVLLTIIFTPLAVLTIMERMIGISATPVKGSESDIALQSFKRHFGNMTEVRTEKVELRCIDGCESGEWRGRARTYVDMLSAKIDAFDEANPGIIIRKMSYFDVHLVEKISMHEIGAENLFMSHDGKSMLFVWIWCVPQTTQHTAEYFTQELNDFIKAKINSQEASIENGRIDVQLTGLVTLGRRIFNAIVDLVMADALNAWMNVVVLSIALRNVKLAILCIIPLAAEVPLGIGSLYFLSDYVDVPYLSAIMCFQMILAMGWDYSLFTLTRYSAERKNGSSVEEALVTAQRHSMPLILVSAMILCISWCALLFMPEMFQAYAACSAIGIIVAAVANVTLVPALLAIMPFLGPPAASRPSSSGGADELDPISKAKQFMSGFHYHAAKYITRRPINIIFLGAVYLLLMPLSIRTFQNFHGLTLDIGHSFKLTLPKGTPEWTTALRVQANFPPTFGVMMPTAILATNDETTQNPTTVVKPNRGHFRFLPWRRHTAGLTENETFESNPKYFSANCRMLSDIAHATKGKSYAIKPDAMFSPAMPVPDAQGDFNCMSSSELSTVIGGRTGYVFGKLPFLASIQDKLIFMSSLMRTDHAMLSLVNPSIDPLSPEAFELMKDMKKVIKEADERDQAETPGIKRMMYGPATYYMDNINYSEGRFPAVFLGCSLVCFLLVTLNFRAIFIPIKLMITVIWPFTWYFGLTLMVFEDGLLDGWGIEGLEPTGDGLDWTVPMFSVTFLIGVALDYDYFLFERIHEFRHEGFGNRESIQLGLSAQATTILAAGLILSFTFLSMIKDSSMPVTNQLGFIYFSGIVMDTFLVRTLVAPAFLSLWPKLNYYPVAVPKPSYEWLDAGANPLTDHEHPCQDEDSEKKTLLG